KVPGTDWSNSNIWCPYDGTYAHIIDSNAMETTPWLIRLVFAYDYLKAGGYTGFTAGEAAAIETWLRNAANLFMTVTIGTTTNNAMSQAYSDPPSYTCDRWACACTGNQMTAWQGYNVTVHEVFTNRMGSGAVLGALVGIMLNDATLQRNTK